jgi:hypothetical protein
MVRTLRISSKSSLRRGSDDSATLPACACHPPNRNHTSATGGGVCIGVDGTPLQYLRRRLHALAVRQVQTVPLLGDAVLPARGR